MERQFPMVYGWQNLLLCQSSFCPVVDESVQIHFTSQNHWVCSTSIGGYLRVYDSAGSKNLNASMESSPWCRETTWKLNYLLFKRF